MFHNLSDNVYGAVRNGMVDDNAISLVLCNIVTLLTGGIAKTVAVVAIVVVAVGLFMGKFSWGVGLATAAGIGMIFGAPTVVRWLASGIRSSGMEITDGLCDV